VAQQSSREFTPTIPTARTSDAAISANEVSAEIRLGPCQRLQSFQFRTSPRQSPNLQSSPLGRFGRVANPDGLNCEAGRATSANWRTVSDRLTAPSPDLQDPSLGCSRRVAKSCGIRPQRSGLHCVRLRRVRIGLTPP